jgi:hypothetical protein
MPPSPRPVDLRLTIPAAAPFHAVAGELAAKFAEYSGAEAGAAAQLAKAVVALAATLGATAPDGSIAPVMEAREQEMVVVAATGARHEQATCPLPA